MKRMKILSLCLLLLLLFTILQNVSIQVENVHLPLAGLPSAFQNLRIVQISDLHGRAFGKDNERLLRDIRHSAPDIICITGDLFDEDTELAAIPSLMERLTEIAPTYYVTGNHEWQYPKLSKLLDKMENCGVCVLRNDYKVLWRGDQKLILAGVHDPCGPYDMKTPKELVAEIHQAEGNGCCILMLDHRNDRIDLWSELGVQGVLSGHCHGGMVRLPFVGGIFGTNRTLFPDYDAGLYQEGDTSLFVSRGLGYSNVRVRLFNPPHLPVLILKNVPKSAK